MANVLITGGSGLIGRHLSAVLLHSGYNIGHLTRKPADNSGEIKQFSWDIASGKIDSEAILWSDHIIHLAGETVGQRWTKPAKEQILNSRIDSTKLLISQLKKQNHQLKSFISASALGFYGDDTGNNLLTEKSPKGSGFLSDVTSAWETAVDRVNNYADRVVKLRIGMVLAKEGGALAKMATPIKWGIGSALGSGKQWLSWIHLDDLCRVILWALIESKEGVYNCVAPNPVTNKDFTKKLANQLKRPVFLPPVPKLVLKMLLGEMAVLALGSNKAMPVALQKEGFSFEFETVEKALASLV